MLCVNPDLVVERGEAHLVRRARSPRAMRRSAGETIIIGKPHAPIYATALAQLGELAGAPVERGEVLAIGDGVETDVRGAARRIDVLFVAGGIHAGISARRPAGRRAMHASSPGRSRRAGLHPAAHPGDRLDRGPSERAVSRPPDPSRPACPKISPLSKRPLIALSIRRSPAELARRRGGDRQFRRRPSRPRRRFCSRDGSAAARGVAARGAHLRAASAHLLQAGSAGLPPDAAPAKARMLTAVGLDGLVVIPFDRTSRR